MTERVFFNFNCIVLDVCRVRIGDYTPTGRALEDEDGAPTWSRLAR